LVALRRSYTHFINRTGSQKNRGWMKKCTEENTGTTLCHQGITPVNEAFDLIKTYGLTVADCRIVKDMEEGLKAAGSIGYPLALKSASPDVLHKTEHGAVLLNIENEAMLIRDVK
jgi:acyl-CoA synthetase (NDP forming)